MILCTDAEVVTVTDTSVVITWFTGSSADVDRYGLPVPLPADTELRLGMVDPKTLAIVEGTLRTVLRDDTPTAWHYAEVHGLQPDTLYGYVALSGGQRARQTSMQYPVGSGGSADYANVFRTLTTPPGHYLFTLALCNDLHIGEEVSGLVAGDWPPSFRQNPELAPYPQVMLEAMLADLRQADRGADRLLVAGDLTSSGELAQARQVRRMLDNWGTLEQDYWVVRGNHDRSRTGDAYVSCRTVPDTSEVHHDCWGEVFVYPWQRLQVHQLGGLRLIGLDTTTLDNPGGTLSRGQLGELADELRQEPERPTLVFGHHPVTYESAVTTGAGPAFNIDRPTAIELQRLYADAPGVFLHHSGHTHRNKRTFLFDAEQNPIRSIEFLEVGAAKEYPGGYSLLRLYSGGYLVSHYKSRTPSALAWGQRTRREYFGQYPQYALGTIADRNHAVFRDLSGLTPLS